MDSPDYFVYSLVLTDDVLLQALLQFRKAVILLLLNAAGGDVGPQFDDVGQMLHIQSGLRLFLQTLALGLQSQLHAADGGKPLADRVRDMAAKFSELGVTREMLEAHLEHGLESCVQAELVKLGRTFNALRDGQVRVNEVFTVPEPAKKGGMAAAAAAPQKEAQEPHTAAKVSKEPELKWPEVEENRLR